MYIVTCTVYIIYLFRLVVYIVTCTVYIIYFRLVVYIVTCTVYTESTSNLGNERNLYKKCKLCIVYNVLNVLLLIAHSLSLCIYGFITAIRLGNHPFNLNHHFMLLYSP